jgi:hypothetical protein
MPRLANPDRDTSKEKRLVAVQKKIAEANSSLMRERNELLRDMAALDYSQKMLSDMMNEANDAANAKRMTPDSVQKAIASLSR